MGPREARLRSPTSGNREIVRQEMHAAMSDTSTVEGRQRVAEARCAYYRRCQVFRKGGEQCKAPAEKGSQICYAHAGQLAMAVRRERERQAVLTEAVAQMRKRGRPECEMADLFMDFQGVNVTLAVVAKALIEGRIDCKTAGRLLVQLQTVSKLLRLHHRVHRGTQRAATTLTTKYTKEHQAKQEVKTERNWAANERERTRIALVTGVMAIANRRGWAHAPPELLMAA